MRITRFADGEYDVKIAESVRGADVFLIQPTCQPVSENLIQLFIILDALRRASAGRITAVVPYYGYARKEKKTQARDPISAKLMADIITLAGANRVIALDLHADAIQGFFDIPVDHLTAEKLLVDYIRELHLRNAVIVSPDVGGAKRVGDLARLLDLPIAFVYKRRPKDDVVSEQRVVGDVEGMDVVVTAGPILARPDPAIPPEWFAEGTLGVPLDYDSYWKPEALAAADRFLTDDAPQLLGTRAGGVFFQRIPEIYGDLGEVAAGLKDGRRHDRERLVCMNLGIALEDMATALLVLERAVASGLGTPLPL